MFVCESIGKCVLLGTNAPEAAALGWAITEALLLSSPAVIMATHFSSLTRMVKLYPEIQK